MVRLPNAFTQCTCPCTLHLVNKLSSLHCACYRSARCVWLCLWVVGTPVIFLLGSGLEATWHLLPAVYLLFDAALLCCSVCTDWSQLAARAKASAFDAKQNERTRP